MGRSSTGAKEKDQKPHHHGPKSPHSLRNTKLWMSLICLSSCISFSFLFLGGEGGEGRKSWKRAALPNAKEYLRGAPYKEIGTSRRSAYVRARESTFFLLCVHKQTTGVQCTCYAQYVHTHQSNPSPPPPPPLLYSRTPIQHKNHTQLPLPLAPIALVHYCPAACKKPWVYLVREGCSS